MQWYIFLSIFLADIPIVMRECVVSSSVPLFAWRELKVSSHLWRKKLQVFRFSKTAILSTFPAETMPEKNSILAGYYPRKQCYFHVCPPSSLASGCISVHSSELKKSGMLSSFHGTLTGLLQLS